MPSNCAWTDASVQTSILVEHSEFVQLMFSLWSVLFWRLPSLIRSRSRSFRTKLPMMTTIIYRSVISLVALQIVRCISGEKSQPTAKCYRMQPIANDRDKSVLVCQLYYCVTSAVHPRIATCFSLYRYLVETPDII